MKTVTSNDGTTIAYDQYGQGPAIILVGGALQYRAFGQGLEQLADLLAGHFTVLHYDRRGRGDSTNKSKTFELRHEIEDLNALIDAVGGSAFVYGISSGGALGLEAAIELGDKIRKLAIYEPPYNDDANARATWRDYTRQLMELVRADRKGDAVGHFMMLTGMPPEQFEGMRQHPMWPLWESIGLTIAYDAVAMGDDSSVPTQRAKRVSVPTLILTGSETYPFMHEAARALVKAIPNAQHRTLEGQSHEVSAEVLAPVLVEFFK